MGELEQVIKEFERLLSEKHEKEWRAYFDWVNTMKRIAKVDSEKDEERCVVCNSIATDSACMTCHASEIIK